MLISYICLRIRGSNRYSQTDLADIGLAGGIGSLSDAEIINRIVERISGIEPSSISINRHLVKEKMKGFYCVLYSFPPPRNIINILKNFIHYCKLYSRTRKLYPCRSLHILTNTGHVNKWVFDSKLLLGSKLFGKVEDMTLKVAEHIKERSIKSFFNRNKYNVLILGTIAGYRSKLYKGLLNQLGVSSSVPTSIAIPKNIHLYRIYSIES